MKEVYILLVVLLFINCGGKQAKPTETEEKTAPSFKMVDIPTIITSEGERAEYLLKHYWDHFDFTDTSYISHPEVTEQAFVDYIDVMPFTSYPVAEAAIKDMLHKAEANADMFAHFSSLYEKYLYDPNSPFRNDEYYIPALEVIIASPMTAEKIRPTSLLELAQKNRIGTKANNFTYTLKNGKKSTLYALQSEYILLFFYNPGCNACVTISNQIQASLTLQYLFNEKRLTILAVYPDEDLEEWENYLSDIPAQWINSYDDGVHLKNEDIYDLKAIPTLYLLNKEKNVLFKDTSFEQIENYFRQLIN